MKCMAISFAVWLFVIAPLPVKAQNTGRIECARNDGYVYLYSSVTTLDVRATLQCGEIVQMLNRYDSYYSVRDAKGDTGYVPMTSIVVLKDQPGTGLPSPGAESPARERIHYDNGPREAPAAVRAVTFMLANDTPIRVKLVKPISSLTARVGDAVEFEALNDYLIDSVLVVSKGAKVTGVVVEAESKKRFGHSGKLGFNITSMRMANGDAAKLRGYQQASGSSGNSADSVLPLASGKDVAIPQDTEFTALVDGDVQLKRESFTGNKEVPGGAPAGSARNVQAKP